MLRDSRRSPIKRCKRSAFGVRGRLDRTQEVAGSSPASSMKDLQMLVFCSWSGHEERLEAARRSATIGDRLAFLLQIGGPIARGFR